MSKRILIIGFIWPEPKSSAAGSRMMQLVEFFLANDYQITFASTSTTSDNTIDLSNLGVTQKPIKLNCTSFDDLVKNLNPDVVLFDRFMTEEQFGWRVTENCPNAIRILDTEDLHCLRKGRQQALKDQKDFNTNYLFNDTAKREIASIYRCDLSLIISEAEMAILVNQFKVDRELLFYLPFMLNEINQEKINDLPVYSERENFVTIGNFLHAPNYDAVLYLKQTIWPLIKKQLPHAELHVYGSYVPDKAKKLHSKKEGLLIKGFAESVHEVMQSARICLAPLRFGAGLKGKLIDAMQNGTPCVISKIAAEGMFGDMLVNGFVSDDPETFAEKAVELYQSEKIWTEFQKNGFKVHNGRFSKTFYKESFFNKLIEVQKNLEERRQNNFIGQMFQHHSLQSTKFMGKWIEEKNKEKYSSNFNVS